MGTIAVCTPMKEKAKEEMCHLRDHPRRKIMQEKSGSSDIF
jgi:hypothetical protein